MLKYMLIQVMQKWSP